MFYYLHLFIGYLMMLCSLTILMCFGCYSVIEETCHIEEKGMWFFVQGLQKLSALLNLTLSDRNMQVRFDFKSILECWDRGILVLEINFMICSLIAPYWTICWQDLLCTFYTLKSNIFLTLDLKYLILQPIDCKKYLILR